MEKERMKTSDFLANTGGAIEVRWQVTESHRTSNIVIGQEKCGHVGEPATRDNEPSHLIAPIAPPHRTCAGRGFAIRIAKNLERSAPNL